MSDAKDKSQLSNARQSPPIPEGLARGLAILLEKRLAQHGLEFDCKAYINKDGVPCIQVYVDNIDDPDDWEDFHYDVSIVTSPDELYAQVRNDLDSIYEL